MDTAGERQRLIVPAFLAGRRLDLVLDALCEGLTRARLQKLVRRGHVRVDGKRVVRSNVHVGARAEIEIEAKASGPGKTPAVGILFEDEHVLVVDKPAGLVTHPAARSNAASVSEDLDRRFGPLPTPFGEERPGVVHRLDRETSGVLVVGRTVRAMRKLQSQFRSRSVEKTYLALVSHLPPAGPFRIDEPIGPVPGKLDRQRVTPPGDGKPASTTVECIRCFARHALVACRPESGRRHQIRVHLSHRGLPILGDELYGTRGQEPLPQGMEPLNRLGLHAKRLVFRHPASGRTVAFEPDLAGDLERVVRQLGELEPAEKSSTTRDGAVGSGPASRRRGPNP